MDDWKNRITPEKIQYINENEVFVFGSNTVGHHLGGAAKTATDKFGAVWGVNSGITGRCYAVPTVDLDPKTRYVEKMPLIYIRHKIVDLINYAKRHKYKTFFITEIGCGIAGFTIDEIAPLFKEAIKVNNIHLPLRFWNKLDHI